MVVIRLVCRGCRPSMNTICDRIMFGFVVAVIVIGIIHTTHGHTGIMVGFVVVVVSQ